jgi:zinc protease
MRRSFALSAIALLIIVGRPDRPVRAQAPADLPKAETVLDQFVEATGGKAAYEKIKSRIASGTIEIVGANVKGTIKISQAEPNRLSVVTNIGPLGQSTQATDGKFAWALSTLMGDRVLEGEEKADFLREAVFNSELRWKELYDKVECTGSEDVDGKPAYKIVLTPKSGKPQTEFYDKTSHLLVKQTATSMSPMGEIPVEVNQSDYKKVDGVLMPFTITQKVAGQKIEIKITEVKQNVDLPADTFKRPASLEEPEKKKAA